MKSKKCGKVTTAYWNPAQNKLVWIKPACGCWKCPKCSKNLKATWISHLTDKLEPHGTIYRLRARGKASFEAIAQTVRRKGGQYARIHTLSADSDCYDIYSTVPVAGSERMTRNDAIAVLTRALNAIPVDVRTVQPVSTSRKWKRPAREKRGFQRVLPDHVIPKSAFIAAAEKFKAEITEWTPTNSPSVVEGLRLSTRGWTSQKFDAFVETLECMSLPISRRRREKAIKGVSYRGRTTERHGRQYVPPEVRSHAG